MNAFLLFLDIFKVKIGENTGPPRLAIMVSNMAAHTCRAQVAHVWFPYMGSISFYFI